MPFLSVMLPINRGHRTTSRGSRRTPAPPRAGVGLSLSTGAPARSDCTRMFALFAPCKRLPFSGTQRVHRLPTAAPVTASGFSVRCGGSRVTRPGSGSAEPSPAVLLDAGSTLCYLLFHFPRQVGLTFSTCPYFNPFEEKNVKKAWAESPSPVARERPGVLPAGRMSLPPSRGLWLPVHRGCLTFPDSGVQHTQPSLSH